MAAVDLGEVRIGLAVSDDLNLFAHPRDPLDGGKPQAAVEHLAELAREEGIVRFVVGLPLTLQGRALSGARRAARFCQALAEATGCEVELLDERFTSVLAERQLAASGVKSRRAMRGQVDGVAAAILLQEVLDRAR
ncbi:MAG: Holliday junction resolvase RuvX [Myxococcota bacterium]